jgi:hypothetical protein
MINPKYLPSKKFSISLGIAVLIVLIAIIINYSREGNFKAENNNISAEKSLSNALADANSIDTDGDSIPDWKEVLYGTDPKKGDTDGDGTKDDDEIKISRDPLKANTASASQKPNDFIDPAIITKDKQAEEEYAKLTPTEKIARDLFSNIVASQPTNGSMTQDQINSLVQGSISNMPQKEYSGITKMEDLNLIADSIPSDAIIDRYLLTYRDSYKQETEKFRKIIGKDLTIIDLSATTEKDIKVEAQKMTEITSSYQEIVDNLIKIPLPAKPKSRAALTYLQLINNLEKIIAIDNDLIISRTDMASYMSDLANYQVVMEELTKILDTLDSVLKIKRD